MKNKIQLFEGSQLVSNTIQLKMVAPDGKMRLTDAADTEQILRLIRHQLGDELPPKSNKQLQVVKNKKNEFRPQLVDEMVSAISALKIRVLRGSMIEHFRL